MYSLTTDLCMFSGRGMDGLGRYLWRHFEFPDKDGVHTFVLTDSEVHGK